MLKNIALLIILATRLAHAQSKTDVVASVLVLEAADQGKNGMLAVHEILINRAKSNSIESKYKQARKPRQFSCLNRISDKRAVQIASKSPAWDLALRIAENRFKSNLTNGAQFYFSDSISTPYWAEGKKIKKIGNHIFVLK